jgi:hypothetical protein
MICGVTAITGYGWEGVGQLTKLKPKQKSRSLSGFLLAAKQ